MSDIILKVENISKQYRLGLVGTGTLSHDLNRLWYRIRGKEDPYLKIGDENNREKEASSDYVWALRDISFEVKRGEVLGIIGKNGAGKSTLLKILSKVTGPTTGVIKSRGRIASLLEVGTGFHPELTGKENIYLNGAILGMTKAEIRAKIDEIVDFSGCELYIDTPVKRYSSGMRVRLAFAVAAHLEPDILVVDEVLAVGDASFQKKAVGKMQDISKGAGRTVLFVSHNMASVKKLCTRAMVLEHGKAIYEGTADEAVDFYLTRETEKASLNLLERTDRKGTGEVRFSKVEMLNSKNEPVAEVMSNMPVTFRIHMVFKEPFPANRLTFGVVIYDANDHKIADFYTDEMGVKFEEINDFIDLEIPNLSLRGGSYTLVLVVQTAKDVSVSQIDLVTNAFQFSVFAGDFWNTGGRNRATNVALIPGIFKN